MQYTYDLFGRRIGKQIDSDADGLFETEEHYVYDGQRAERSGAGDQIVLAFDGSGELTNRYLHGPAVDQVLADEDALGDVLWALADNLGSIRDWAAYDDVLDQTSIADHIIYDSFGRITSQSDATHDLLYAYTGREWDVDVELYHYRRRWYDPAVGRFLSEDPIACGK